MNGKRNDLPASNELAARLRQTISSLDPQGPPRIEIIKPASHTGPRIGVFASSFNPVTVAHTELMSRALSEFALDEMLALAGCANADKTSYECSLEDRLQMLMLAAQDEAHISIGLSSHAFYIDMLAALTASYPQSDLHFVVGFDTFERVLDRDSRYAERYHCPFSDRLAALLHLFSQCWFIVAGRAGAGRDEIEALLAAEPATVSERVSYLDFPAELAERSATEVRDRQRRHESIAGLVPATVGDYITTHGLYQ